MLTEPDRTGHLTGTRKGCLKQQLKQRGHSPFLRGYRELYRGRATPPRGQFR